MQNPFVVLGVDENAGIEEVRAAYHALAKRCHPDGLVGEECQKAQEKMIRLNLAYEQAKQLASKREERVPGLDPMQVARQLYHNGMYDGALRALNRAVFHNEDWYDLRGCALLNLRRPQEANVCFRQAVKLCPGNDRYREHALQAAMMIKKQKTLRGKMACWARNMLHRERAY